MSGSPPLVLRFQAEAASCHVKVMLQLVLDMLILEDSA